MRVSLLKNALVFALVAATFGLSGCATGVAVGVGAAGVTSAQKEKGFGASIDDAEIEIVLNKRLLDEGSDIFLDVNTEVEEGRVLLAGSVETVEQRLNAVRVAWGVEGVNEVINEIEIGDEDSVIDFTRDTWITTQLETTLLFDGAVSSIDYSVETVNQTVYVMGIARNDDELERVIGHAKDIDYVRRVVSYVRILEPENDGGDGNGENSGDGTS